MSVTRWILLALVVAVGLTLLVLARTGPRLTEEERIREGVERARRAAVAHNLSEVMSVVSRRYDDGSHTFDTLRALVAAGLREYSDLEVTTYLDAIVIQGDQASAKLELRASGVSRGSGERNHYEGVLHLKFVREPARRAWFFPDHRWRVVRAENLPDVEDAFGP